MATFPNHGPEQGRPTRPAGGRLGALAAAWWASAWLLGANPPVTWAEPDGGAGLALAPRGGLRPITLRDLRNVDPGAVVGHVRAHARPLTAAAIFEGPEPVVYVGEDHRDPAVKGWLAARLPQARAAGIVTLGLEALGWRRQPALDAYLGGGSSRATLLALFRSEWGYAPDAYVQLIVAAREAGLRVVALDRRMRRPDGVCRLRVLGCAGRDCCMASRIARVGPKPAARLLALVGSDHARADRQPRQLREFHALASRSYWFTTRADPVGRLLRRVSGTEDTFLATPADADGYDGIVFLP